MLDFFASTSAIRGTNVQEGDKQAQPKHLRAATTRLTCVEPQLTTK